MNNATTHSKDLLIIGQGIAGTLTAFEAELNGMTYDIYDVGAHKSSSAVCSGIINPVTGSKYIKSWMIDQFMPVTREVYANLEKKLSIKLIHKIPLWRHIPSIFAENLWESRMVDPGYSGLLSRPDNEEIKSFFNDVHDFGRVDAAFRIDTLTLIRAARRYFEVNEVLVEEYVDTREIKVSQEFVTYKDKKYVACVSALGYRGCDDILFQTESYRPVKGEILVCHIPDLPEDLMLKFNKFIIPLGNHQYWIGSNYQFDFTDNSPDEEMTKDLIDFLERILKANYEIVDHKAGIRPATKYRRPLIGAHKEYSNLYLFNGLGTKGISMAPYFSKQIIAAIKSGVPFQTEAYEKSFQDYPRRGSG